MITRENLAVAIGCIAAVLLQVVVAPNIAIFSAMPNFILAYSLSLAIARPHTSATLPAFILGLVYNLIGGGPVGAMAFLLTLGAFLATRIFSTVDNNTLFMPFIVLMVSACAVEVFYAVILLILGSGVGFVDAFVYRVLPCALYDCVAGLVLYPLVVKFVVSSSAGEPFKMPRLR